MRSFWFGLLFLIIAGTILYFGFFFPKFQITQVAILGNEKISAEDLRSIAVADISKNVLSKSFLMVNTKKITRDVLHAFPKIENVITRKKFPETIELTIKERIPFAVFCDHTSQCFSMDENGVIFELLEKVPQDTFTVTLGTDEEFLLGQTAVAKNIVEIIADVRKKLKDNHQVNIKQVLASNPLIITTTEGWQIYFDPTGDAKMEITKMDLLLKNEITSEKRRNLKYIYLQYKDRAYYK